MSVRTAVAGILAALVSGERTLPSAAVASHVDSRIRLRQVRRRSGLPAQRFGEVS